VFEVAVDPLQLNTVYFLDALIYGVTNDFVSRSATVTIEVQPEFHKGTERLLVDTAGSEVMIDFVFGGVRSLHIHDAPARPKEWADDEKPHNHEISTLEVRKLGSHHRLEIVCQLGMKIAIEFDSVTTVRSARPPGVVHDYGESASKSPP
jgi:hypothetical protein